jgi:hypothetical protein
VRPRPALSALEAGPQPAAAAEAVWAELLGQSWKTELDYGLGSRGGGGGGGRGKGGSTGPAAAAAERVLVVAGPRAVEQLTAALGCGGGAAAAAAAAASGGAGVEVEVDGWNVGVPLEAQRPLGSWRELRPRLKGWGGAAAGGGSSRSSSSGL